MSAPVHYYGEVPGDEADLPRHVRGHRRVLRRRAGGLGGRGAQEKLRFRREGRYQVGLWIYHIKLVFNCVQLF